MLTIEAIKNWSLDKCNEELGAAGHYSLHGDVTEAREAVVAMACELGMMPKRKPTQITVYWDRSDWENQSWAYRATYQHDREESGALMANELHDAIDEACSELDMPGIEQDFALSIEEGGYAIWSLPQ